MLPATRAHVRLLGPCFKTGRESIRRRSAADGSLPPSEDSGEQQPTGAGAGAGAVPSSRRACPPGRMLALRGSEPSPRGLPLGAGRDIRGTVLPRESASVPSVSSRALGRCPTGRDVLLGGRSAPHRGRTSGPGATDSDPARALRRGWRSAASFGPVTVLDDCTATLMKFV